MSRDSVASHVDKFVQAACNRALWNSLRESRCSLFSFAGNLVLKVLDVIVCEDQRVCRAVWAECHSEWLRSLICNDSTLGVSQFGGDSDFVFRNGWNALADFAVPILTWAIFMALARSQCSLKPTISDFIRERCEHAIAAHWSGLWGVVQAKAFTLAFSRDLEGEPRKKRSLWCLSPHSLDVADGWCSNDCIAFLWHLESDSELVAEASEFLIRTGCGAEGLEVHGTGI